MGPIKHFLLGIILALILFFIFPQITWIEFFLIFASTVLIDVDHYTYYVYKKKDWNLKKAFSWYLKNGKKYLSMSREQKDTYYTGFCFLHGIEILAILFLLGKFFSIYFYYILIGFIFHMFLDTIDQIILKKRIDKLSIIYDFLNFRKLKLIQEDGRE